MDNTPSTRDPLKHITITFSKQVAELWHKLFLLGHEMFIAPGGQPLDPPLLFEVTGLDSTKSYLFSAVFEPVSNNKLEYSSESGSWKNSECRAALTLTASSQSPKGFQTGAAWMKENIDFQHLKIDTDVSSDEYGIRLRPFHRYALFITIYVLSSKGVLPPITTRTVKITDGEFIPVTHFYNPSMRRMKILCPEEQNVSEMVNRKRIHQDDSNLVVLKKAVRNTSKTIKLGNSKTFTKPDEEIQTNSVTEEQEKSDGAQNKLRYKTLQLSYDTLWENLSGHGHEMLISPEGCSIKPPLKFKVNGLDPGESYTFSLHFESLNNKRNAYNFERGIWYPTEHREHVKSTTPIMHSKGARREEEWRNEEVDFQNLKLVTNKNPEDPHSIYLELHHWYIPVITIYQVDSDIFEQFKIKTTQFITVEHYHKPHVRDLKGFFKEPTATSLIKSFKKVDMEEPVVSDQDYFSQTTHDYLTNALLSSSGCELLLSNQINQIKISFPSRFDAFFSELRRNGYEMLVAPGGLSLYPCLQCQVFGLDATKFYAFEMVFEASETKMQFSPESMEWEVTNEREEVPRSRSFPHPGGIKRGSEWMANGINFEYLKTASNENPRNPNAVSLRPNHSYMPTIVVILCDATKYKRKLTSVRLLKAEFVPVLEYHTSKMAEMKATPTTSQMPTNRKIDSSLGGVVANYAD